MRRLHPGTRRYVASHCESVDTDRETFSGRPDRLTMIFVDTRFCNLHRDATWLHFRQTLNWLSKQFKLSAS